ncbi:AraC family transcriptional regulator [Clostridium thailandense]|uniref:AraC family transcriptional regulator n=1 Tax=Clostridium thailandense TaxID=2794346 RepID=UPI003989B1A7
MSNIIFVNQEILHGESLIYYVNRAGRNHQVESEFNIKRNSSYPYCVIHYVLKGSGTVLYRNKKHNVKEGQIFILNAYEPHHYIANEKDPFLFNWIEFSGGDSVKILNSILDNQSPVVKAPFSNIVNKYILRSIYLLQKNAGCNAILVSKILYSMLLKLLDLSKHSIYNEETKLGLECIRRTIEYINCNLGESLTIEKLSKISNFSPSYFSRIFHKTTGVTPTKYIFSKRINKAKELLCTSDIKVELISDNLGFCNTSHFIRLFKKAEGLTPAEYRRQSKSFRGIDI